MKRFVHPFESDFDGGSPTPTNAYKSRHPKHPPWSEKEQQQQDERQEPPGQKLSWLKTHSAEDGLTAGPIFRHVGPHYKLVNEAGEMFALSESGPVGSWKKRGTLRIFHHGNASAFHTPRGTTGYDDAMGIPSVDRDLEAMIVLSYCAIEERRRRTS